MGTNYYLHDREPCSHCGREFPSKHIGKSSWGWCFGLHVIPEDGIATLDDWRDEWAQPGAYIVDEYGSRVSVEEMERIITQRAKTHSARGGLVRHHIDDRLCVGHGEGTWDYIVGEFS